MTDPGVIAPPHKNWKSTLPRVKNFYTLERYRDTNLTGKLYPEKQDVKLSHWELPGGEGSWQNYTFEQIKSQTFTPVKVGSTYGPLWATHWFKVEFEIPESWAGEEVRFRWNSNSEAAFWNEDGQILQSFSTEQKRTDFVIYKSYAGGEGLKTYYIEMASNTIFGGADDIMIDPPNKQLAPKLEMAEICLCDSQIFKLTLDFDILYQLAENWEEDQRGFMALFTANQMINDILKGDFDKASELADEHFKKGNGERALTLSAIGNCHIDTAWLWPYSETRRKSARSFCAQVALMDQYPDFIFVASQAQQWDWIKKYYPELYGRMKMKVAAGTFLPVGTTWVEMDGNIPSGESFIRQFYYGYKFYLEEFGYICKEYWLPDTFGYSAQIPAMMKHVGLSRFLTQKMSWNLVNTFPHHNFLWEGIDGTTVLAHFPPGNRYDLEMNVEEAIRTETNLSDKGRVSTAAFLYGWGDGGGGPTEKMVEKAHRMKDIDGLPKMKLTTPNDLFEQIESDKENLCRWVGELFLELHNGTYTSQADGKKYCRSTEFKLRDAEFMLSAAAISGAATGTFIVDQVTKLEPVWKNVLLNQFHDVLPGTSINLVYEQVNKIYAECAASADSIMKTGADKIFGEATSSTPVALNTLQWPRKEIVKIDSKVVKKKNIQSAVTNNRQIGDDSDYYMVEAPAFGYAPVTHGSYNTAVTITDNNGIILMDNGLVRAEVSAEGQLISLKVGEEKRDLLQDATGENKFGNQITLYDNEPKYWDAWDIMDYHLETATVLNGPEAANVTKKVSIVESGPMVGRLTWSMTIGKSSIFTQDIIMNADCPYITFDTTVDWQESHKLLKTVFDSKLLVRNASYDIQFGFLQRPTHMNTSWDAARYEVCGHKWADISEPNIGMSIFNDSKFGWCGRGNTLTLTLLKSPKAPDPTCDMKVHHFKYAVMLHKGTLQDAEVMRIGYEFNNPLRVMDINSDFAKTNSTWKTISVDGTGIVLHTIKPADDDSGDVIIRMFECNGMRSSVTITIPTVVTVKECNGLEITSDDVTVRTENESTYIPVELTPFQIYAIRLNKTASVKSSSEYSECSLS